MMILTDSEKKKVNGGRGWGRWGYRLSQKMAEVWESKVQRGDPD